MNMFSKVKELFIPKGKAVVIVTDFRNIQKKLDILIDLWSKHWRVSALHSQHAGAWFSIDDVKKWRNMAGAPAAEHISKVDWVDMMKVANDLYKHLKNMKD